MRWWSTRIVVGLVMAVQLSALVIAYDVPTKVLGWQMFNAPSDWQAEIVRVTPDGQRHDVRDARPGSYRWENLLAS